MGGKNILVCTDDYKNNRNRLSFRFVFLEVLLNGRVGCEKFGVIGCGFGFWFWVIFMILFGCNFREVF